MLERPTTDPTLGTSPGQPDIVRSLSLSRFDSGYEHPLYWADIVFTGASIHLFRSEEGARTWMAEAGRSLAGSMTLDQCWEVSENWYMGRLDLGYQRPALGSFRCCGARAWLVMRGR